MKNVNSVEECQSVCQSNGKCAFFVFHGPDPDPYLKSCKLYEKSALNNRNCKLIQGTVEPLFTTCVDSGKIPWVRGAKYIEGLNSI